MRESRSFGPSPDGSRHPGARHSREPGIHNHRIEFGEDSGLPASPHNRRLWLWILRCAIAHHSSRSARPGMTKLHPGYAVQP